MLRPSFSDANAVDRIPQLSGRVGIFMAAPGTRREITPADDHYRMDINLIPPFIDGRAWTWVLWRYDWPFESGCRCASGRGQQRGDPLREWPLPTRTGVASALLRTSP
jgi:hypothetical protein